MGKSPEPQLTLAIVEDLKNKGFTQSQIARQFGVTKQYVSWIVRTYGGKLTPRQEVLQHFPWDVPAAFHRASPCRRLREHAEYMVTGGEGMREDSLQRLRSFYRLLRNDNVVVEYDPDIPPTPGNKHGGFAYRQRQPEDGNLLIRVNKHTMLTDVGRRVWVFPTQDP